MNAADLVASMQGPKICIAVSLARYLKDIQAAVMLSEGAFLSAINKHTDGWFYLNQEGEGSTIAQGIFADLGSWESLGIGSPKVQVKLRDKLKSIGVWQDELRGIPARLHYKVDLDKYLKILEDASGRCQFGHLGETGLTVTNKLDLLQGQTNKEINKNIKKDPQVSVDKSLLSTDSNEFLLRWSNEVEPLISVARRPVARIHFLGLKCIDGESLSRADWMSVIQGARSADSPAAWIAKIAQTGYEPGRLPDLAQPGESIAQAKTRLQNRRNG